MLTKVTNIGSDDLFFGWLPPHGATIAAGDHVILDGDLKSVLAGGRARYSRATELASLDADIANGVVTLVNLDESSSSL